MLLFLACFGSGLFTMLGLLCFMSYAHLAWKCSLEGCFQCLPAGSGKAYHSKNVGVTDTLILLAFLTFNESISMSTSSHFSQFHLVLCLDSS